jgi:hypothetical protein
MDGKCYILPYYKYITDELLKKVTEEETELEDYFFDKLEKIKEKNKAK